MIKLIVSDLDGTLLNENREISGFTKSAIEFAIRRGVIFAAASGRFYNGINEHLKDYDNNMVLISHNGSWIQKAGYGEVLYKNTMPLIKAKNFVSAIREKYNIKIYLAKSDVAIIDDPSENVVEGFKKSGTNCQVVDDLLNYEGEICRIGLTLPEEGHREMIEYIMNRFSNEYEITLGGELWVDVMEKGVSKGTGIEMIQKMYDITPEETMVFGDYYNDIEMFKKAHYSFAMEHAPDEVKKYANFTAKTNKEDGVAREILNICG